MHNIYCVNKIVFVLKNNGWLFFNINSEFLINKIFVYICQTSMVNIYQSLLQFTGPAATVWQLLLFYIWI